jgi:hypothetical protein
MKKTRLDFETLREVNVKRCEKVFHPLKKWSRTDWATAMIKKLRRELTPAEEGAITRINRDIVADEIAEVIIYADLLAARMGINLSESVTRKFNIVSDRKGTQIKLPTLKG